MANIILLAKDHKLTREIRGYVQELSDKHRFRNFENAKAWEARYFPVGGGTKEAEGLSDHPTAKKLNDDQLEWITEQTLSEVKGFPGESVDLILKAENLSLIEVEADEDLETIFGVACEDLLDMPDKLWELIDAKFEDSWKTFVTQIRETHRGDGLFPFKDPEGQIWLTRIIANATDDQIDMKFKVLNSELKEMIAVEKEKIKKRKNEPEELQLVSTIDLLLVDKEALEGENVLEWVQKTFKQLHEKGYFPDANRTRLMVIKWEDDGIAKSKFAHPLIDDMVCLPLDRLLFLQKVEIVLSLPGKVQPKYLFTQDVKMDVEISKLSRIERISDVGFAVRNPVRLVPGLLGHFYFKLPGDETMLSVYGKAARSEPHPDIEGQYLVYFNYFGISKDILSQIRRYLMSTGNYKNLVDQDPMNFTYNPDNIFYEEEEKAIKTVVYIDADPESSNSVREMLQNEIAQVNMVYEDAYAKFLRKYISPEESKAKSMKADILAKDEIYAEVVSWTLKPEHFNLNRLENPPDDKSGESILGFSVEELFAKPEDWRQLFKLKETEEILNEYLEAAKRGQEVQSNMELVNKDQAPRLVNVTFQRTKADVIRIELKPPDIEATPGEAADEPVENLDSIDMLIIDHALVPNEVEQWLEELHEAAEQAGVINKDELIKIVVLGPADGEFDEKIYRNNDIYGLYLRPTERRSLLYCVSVGINNPFTLYNFKNVGWKDIILPVYIAKETTLEQLSEFGCSIHHPRPISAGTTVYLHGGIFANAPDGNLCCRVYFSEEHPEEDDDSLCSILYFGINDQFLKYTRAWIRDHYASQKSKGR